MQAGEHRERVLQGQIVPPSCSAGDDVILWATCSSCFFGYFRSGEITVPSARAFDKRVHLSWRDITVDRSESPTRVHFLLKRSKRDQFSRVVEVFVGATQDALCPVRAIVTYTAQRGKSRGPFFKLSLLSESTGSPHSHQRLLFEGGYYSGCGYYSSKYGIFI